MRKLLYPLVIILFGFNSFLNGQCDPPSPDLTPTTLCDISTPSFCLPGACYTTVNQSDEGHVGFCGPMTIINNPQYIAFIAEQTVINIVVQVGSCGGGNSALQAALIDNCMWDNTNVIDCDAGTGTGGTINMTIPTAVIGQTYYLLFDGSNGSLCEYTIVSATGVQAPNILGDLSSASTLDFVVCQGQDLFTAMAEPYLPNAPKYEFTLPWGPEISSSNILTTSVPNDAPLGTFSVCVTAFSGCDTTDTQPCFDMTIVAVDDRIKPPVTFCPEDLPISWAGNSISAAGMYTGEFNNVAGCPFDSIWIVDVYPMVGIGLVDTVHCGIEMDYEGITYTNDGQFPLFYQSLGLNGCDSNATLDLILVDFEADLEFECQDGEFVFELTGVIFQPLNATIEYEWFNGGVLIPGEDASNLTVIDGGTYSVLVTLIVNGEECEYLVVATPLIPENEVPSPPTLLNGDTTICPNQLATFMVADDQIDIIEYAWSGPPDVVVFDDGTSSVDVDFSSATGSGQICVFATNECGEGLPACFDFELIEIPVVDIQAPLTVCVDSVATIVFNGEASNNAVYVWTFGGGGTIVSGTGEGPYEVSWPTPGEKNIIVSVAEIGCDTVAQEIQITVESQIPPVIGCISAIGAVTFFWDPIPGVTGYSVEVINGTTQIVTDTSYTISGLDPDDVVNVIIAAISPAGCYSEGIALGCNPIGCIAPNIDIVGEDSICLSNADPTYDLNAFVNSTLTDGVWSGPGIINSATGIFDPTDVTAGPGTHNILFTYTENQDCIFRDSISISVFNFLTPEFTIEDSICIDGSAMIMYTGSNDPGTNFTWNFDNPSNSPGTGAGPFNVTWATAGIKNVSVRINRNGCVSELITHQIKVQPRLNAPIVNCTPNTSTVEFFWNNVNNSSGFNLNVLQGPAGNQVGNSVTFDGLIPGDTIRIELITLSANLCPDLIDTFECVARICPMPVIMLDSVPPICLEASTPIIDLNAIVTNGNGSGIWTGVGVTDLGNGDATFNPNDATAGVGQHPMVYTYNDDGCTFINTIDIDVFETPSAMISNTDLILDCDNNNLIELDGSNSFPGAGLVFTWSTIAGAGNVVSGQGTSLATVNTAGTYQLKVTTPNGCLDSTQIVITQDDGSPIADAGPDDILNCIDRALTIGAAATSEGNDITYQWTTTDGAIMGDPTFKRITVNEAGTYSLLVSNNVNGCFSMDEVTILLDTTKAEISLEIPDFLDCDTESLMLRAMVLNNVNDISIVWTSQMGGVIESGANTLQPIINTAGIYQIEITNNETGCVATDELEVMLDENVIADVVVEMGDINCFEENNGFIFIDQIIGGNAPFTIIWSNESENDSLLNLSAGTYSLTVSDVNGCSFEGSYTIVEPPSFDVDINLDLSIYVLGQTATASINSTNFDVSQNGYQINWFIGSQPSDSLCRNEISCSFDVVETDSISVLITNPNGCITSTSKLFVVRQPRIVFMPNTITPNGDQINDEFRVFSPGVISRIVYMEIYNRWGDQVFSMTNVDNPEEGWDGRLSNSNEFAEPGVYVYKLKVEYNDGEEEEVFVGDLTLLR